MSHYQKQRDPSSNTNVEPEEKTADKKPISESDTSSAPTPTSQVKEYTSLRKLTKRNEHTTQVRRIQNAAIKIQRVWRRHQAASKS